MIIDSLGNKQLEMFGRQTIKELELGRSNDNRGVLILVVWWPRDISVHVGDGLKSTISDDIARRISDVEMERIFTQDDFEGGLTYAVNRIGELIKKGT